jgi:hypothetical protein
MKGGEDKFEDIGDDEMDATRMIVASRPGEAEARFTVEVETRLHRRAHPPQRRTVRMGGIYSGWEQWFLLSSDRHHDNPECDQKLEKKHLDEAKERKAGVIDAGDLHCAMQGKFDKRGDKSALRPEHQHGDYLDKLVSTAADFYEPYAKHLIVLGQGNHETAILKRPRDEPDRAAGRAAEEAEPHDPVRRLRRLGAVPVHVLEDRAHLAAPALLPRHGRRRARDPRRDPDQPAGRVQPRRGHRAQRAHARSMGRPDRTPAHQRGRHPFHDEQVHVRTPGYKDGWGDGYGGWETEKMLGPKPKGAAWLRFWLHDNQIITEITRAA